MTQEDQIQEMSRAIDTLRTALSAANETLKYVLEDRQTLKEELWSTRDELKRSKTPPPLPKSSEPPTSPPPRRSVPGRLAPPDIPHELEESFDIEMV